MKKAVSDSLEFKCCDKLQRSLIPAVQLAFNDLENKASELQLCMEEFTPALQSAMSSLGILDRVAIRLLGTKHKIAFMVRNKFEISEQVVKRI